MGACKVCGAPHKACGPSTTVIPVDSNITRTGITVGLKRYDIVTEGRHPHHTTVLLSDEEAKRLGVFVEDEHAPKQAPAEPAVKQSRLPWNKARKPANKAAEEATDPSSSV